ncbi:MAG: hypothetical protein ABSF09_00105 [Candidatus Bathyarchaeia archaeon]|jgi:hypothetical protein
MRTINGFTFNDFCPGCGKVTENRIAVNGSVVGVCVVCASQRPLTELKQVFYSKTDLWVTRFKVGNLNNVVAGKLLDTIRRSKGSE